MKVHEQMGRYYQVTHIVVQPTVYCRVSTCRLLEGLGMTRQNNNMGDKVGDECPSEI
jgi:hypothetical protein